MSTVQEIAAEFRAKGYWGDATICDYFAFARKARPDQLAYKDRRGSSLTFRELDQRSAAIAGWLKEAGVSAGDIVSVQIPNWVEFAEVFVACMKLGAVINPLATNLRVRDLEFIFSRCRTVAAFFPSSFRSNSYVSTAQSLLESQDSLRVVGVVEPDVGGGAVDGTGSLVGFEAIENFPRPLPVHEEYRGVGSVPAAVIFTSGSEATPKGVLLSHNNLAAVCQMFMQTVGFGWDDRMFMAAPLGHATGFFFGIVMGVVGRVSSVLCDSTDPVEMVDFMEATACTGTMGVPTLVDYLLKDALIRHVPLARMRFVACGGAPMPRALVRRAQEFGVRLVSVYGATECAPIVMSRGDEMLTQLWQSDGRVCDGVHVKIVDPCTKEEVPSGDVGELVALSPSGFLGYLGEPEMTAASRDPLGWFYSGDLARAGAQGRIEIVGRIKDTIIRGGENISVREIEDLVAEVDCVEDVAVAGVEDALLGQRTCAVVVLRPGCHLTVADLREHFVRGGVAKYKIPEYLIEVEEIPRLASGKVDRMSIRRMCSSAV
ncbi:acyl-CoA synthetase [Arcanobacterium wilhelmae]|uniref:Acyl-CoA synthetase n=1 Tax=Arcanobacterium wilhelmae TaxID=1803177 RepID=A0ABT9NAN4_9ACTO|nr:AMP-binding protein [Arcanobacterium wilhelmae]MDP9800758.1 acyl-CoA synthetase [Arcanobacterium wilhelmae]